MKLSCSQEASEFIQWLMLRESEIRAMVAEYEESLMEDDDPEWLDDDDTEEEDDMDGEEEQPESSADPWASQTQPW